MSEAAKRSTRVQEATVSAREQELAKKLLFDSKAQREYVQHFMGWVTQTKGVQQQERILVVGEFRLTTLKKHAGLVKGRSKLSISKHFPFINLRFLKTSVIAEGDQKGRNEMHCVFSQDDGSRYPLNFSWPAGANVAGKIIDPVVRQARRAQAQLPADLQFKMELHDEHAAAQEEAQALSEANAFVAMYRAECERAGVASHSGAIEYLKSCFKGKATAASFPFLTPRKTPYGVSSELAPRLRQWRLLEARELLGDAIELAKASSKRPDENAVGDDDVKALAHTLEHSHWFHGFAANGVGLSKNAVKFLLAALITGGVADGAAGDGASPGNPLVSLTLKRNIWLNGAALAPLPKLLAANDSVKLAHLDLSQNALNDATKTIVATLTHLKDSLRFLSLQSCSLLKPATKAILDALHGCNLVKLDLSNNTVSSNKLRDFIAQSQSLRELQVWSTFIQLDKLAIALSENAPLQDNFKFINVAGNTLGKKEAGAMSELLAHAKVLEWVNLQSVGLNNALLKQLLEAWGTNSAMTAMRENQALCLRANNFSSSKNRAWELLPGCQLGMLDVCDCKLGAKGMAELILAAANLDTLRTLRASRNVGASEGHRAMELLGEALVQLVEFDASELVELELQGDATPKGASFALRQHLLPMLEALQNNQKLTALDISSNDVGNQGAEFLSYTLGENDTLTRLRLDNNHTKVKGMRMLVEALQNNENVIMLEFPSSDSEREAKKSKAKASEVLSCLQDLQEALIRNQQAAGETRARGMSVQQTADALGPALQKAMRRASATGVTDTVLVPSDDEGAPAAEDEDDDGDDFDDEIDAPEDGDTDDDEWEYGDEDTEDDDEVEDEDEVEAARTRAATIVSEGALMAHDLVAQMAEQAGFKDAKPKELGCWMQKRNRAGNQRLRFFAPSGRLLNYYVDEEKKQHKGFLDLCTVTAVTPKEVSEGAEPKFDEFTVKSGGAGAGGNAKRTWTFRTELGQGQKSMGRICRAMILARQKEMDGVSRDATRKGAIWKRNRGKRWVKRFFFLKPASNALVYTVDKEGTMIKGTIPLKTVTSVRFSEKTNVRAPKISAGKDKSKDEDTSTRTKVFKVVVNENTPRERTFVLAAALTEHVDEADEWVEAILAVTPNARLGEDRTADDNESTWRKRKKLEDPYQVRISVAPAGEAVEVQPEEVRQNRADCVREPERAYNDGLAGRGGLEAVTEPPEPQFDEMIAERKRAGHEGVTATGWCSYCHGIDFSDRQGCMEGRQTEFEPKWISIPGEEYADNIATQQEVMQQWQNRQHLWMPQHKQSGGVMSKLSADVISALGFDKPPREVVDTFQRKQWKCNNCTQTVVRCMYHDTRGCQGFCRVDSFNVEAVCDYCVVFDPEEQKQIKDEKLKGPARFPNKDNINIDSKFKWEDIPDGVRGREGYCSWCFESCLHEETLHLPMQSIMSCSNCARPTHKCKDATCSAMARNGEKYCLIHQAERDKVELRCQLCDHSEVNEIFHYGTRIEQMTGWDEGPDALRQKSNCRRWCSNCFELCDHQPVTRGTTITDSIKWACTNCSAKTNLCCGPGLMRNGCDIGMAVNGARHCAACKVLGKKAPLDRKLGWWQARRARSRAFCDKAAPQSTAYDKIMGNDKASYKLPAPSAERVRELENKARDDWKNLLKELGRPAEEALAAIVGKTLKAEEKHDESDDEAKAEVDEEGGEHETKDGAATGGDSQAAAGDDEPAEDDDDDEDVVNDGDTSSWELNEQIRKEAFEKGLIRPLSVMLIMTHRERQAIAGGLGFALSEHPSWGDPFREAKAILWGVKGKCIQERVSDAYEILRKSTGPRSNWYEMVYRSMERAFGTARGVNQEIRSGGRTANFKSQKKDTVFAYSIHTALDPESQTMANAEEALDLLTQKWLEADQQLLPYFEVFNGAVRGNRHPSHLKAQDNAATFIEERLLASNMGVRFVDKPESLAEAAYNQIAQYPDPDDSQFEDIVPSAFESMADAAASAAASAISKNVGTQLQKIVPPHVKAAWKVGKAVVKLGKMAVEMKYGETCAQAFGAVLRITRKARSLDKYIASVQASYDTLNLHCANCEKKELGWTESSCSSSTAGWQDVVGGSRWMIAKEKKLMRSEYKLRHVVLRAGVVEEHEDNIVKPRTKPKKLVPLQPDVAIVDSLEVSDGEEDDDHDPDSGMSDSGMSDGMSDADDGMSDAGGDGLSDGGNDVVPPGEPPTTSFMAEDASGGASSPRSAINAGGSRPKHRRGGAGRSSMSSLDTTASISRSDATSAFKRNQQDMVDFRKMRKATVYAMCHSCGYCSPLNDDGAASAGVLQMRAQMGDRNDLLHDKAKNQFQKSADGRDLLTRTVRKHSVHVLQLWDKKGAIQSMLDTEMVQLKNPKPNKAKLLYLPMRAGDADRFRAAADDAQLKLGMYKDDSERFGEDHMTAGYRPGSDEAPFERAPHAFSVEVKASEQRSDGQCYVLEVSSPPGDAQWGGEKWYVRKTVSKLRRFHKAATHHFKFVPLPKASSFNPSQQQFEDMVYYAANKRAFFESAEFRDFVDKSLSIKWQGMEGAKDPNAHTVEVVGYEHRPHRNGNYLIYFLRVTQKGHSWVVGKRYQEFVDLNRLLLKASKDLSLMKLPPKLASKNSAGRSRFGFGRSAVDSSYLDERMVSLQGFLSDCLLQDDLLESKVFMHFIQPPSQAVEKMLALEAATRTDAQMAAAPVKSGILVKRGLKRKNWKQRFFVLLPAEHKLRYYAKGGGGDESELQLKTVTAEAGGAVRHEVEVKDGFEGHARLMGSVELRNILDVRACTDETITAAAENPRPHALELVQAGRIWVIDCGSAEEQEAWKTAVNSAMPDKLSKSATFNKLSDHRGKWNSRFFILDPVAQTISYFEAEGKTCRGDIRFRDITIAEKLPAVQFPDVVNPFRICTDFVEWTLHGEDERAVAEFLETLRSWVGTFKVKKRVRKKKQVGGSYFDNK